MAGAVYGVHEEIGWIWKTGGRCEVIGVIFDENCFVVELWPVFGSDKGIPNWVVFHIPVKTTGKLLGHEYGVAFSGSGKKGILNKIRGFTVWWHWKDASYPRDINFYLRRRKWRKTGV